MAQKVLNEEQMREFVEQEVRKALMNEEIDEGLLSTLLGGALGNGLKRPSMEAIVGALLGNIAVAPLLTKLLASLGIPANSAIGKFIVETAVSAGGAKLGDWIDRKWDPIGVDNLIAGRQPQQQLNPASE
jgi:hypothetical protein